MSTLSGMQFGLRVTAQDDTRAGLNSVLGNISSLARSAVKPIVIPLQIARGGLGILRDLQMGLRPTVEMLDRFVTRGAGLEAVQRAFTSQTGQGARRAEFYSRSLQAATFNTLRWADAMKLANRGLADGIGTENLNSIFRFATVKAAAIGESTEGVLGGLLRGLGLGSGRVLKEFGLDLGDVEDRYARIKGVGAFDDLPFAERRMVILAAATQKMAEETQKLKLTGRESGFVWQGIKTQVGDAVDKLTLAVVKSDAMRGALTGVRDVLGGITRHFQEDGTFEQLFLGKGDSGGILGLLKAGFLDAGEALGKSILRGVIGAILEIRKLMGGGAVAAVGSFFKTAPDGSRSRAGPGLTAANGMLLEGFYSSAGVDAVSGEASAHAIGKGGRGALGSILRAAMMPTSLTSNANFFKGPMPSITDVASLGAKNVWDTVFMDWYHHSIRGLALKWQEETGSTWSLMADAFKRWIGNLRNPRKWMVNPPKGGALNRGLSMGGGAMHPMLAMMQGVGSAAMGGIGDLFGGNFFDGMQKYYDQGGGGDSWGRVRSEWGAFGKAFPGGMPEDVGRAGMLMDPSNYRLTMNARMSLKRKIAGLRHREANIGRGGEFARRDANLSAAAEIADLKRKGAYLSGSDIQEVYARHRAAAIKQRMGAVSAERSGLEGDLERDDATREINRRIKRLTTVGRRDPELDAHLAQRVRESYYEGGRLGGESDEMKSNKWAEKHTKAITAAITSLENVVKGFAQTVGVQAAQMPGK